jgi:hypothetical protein
MTAAVAPAAGDEPDAKGIEFFESKIRPVLSVRCYSCHSAKAREAKKLKGGLLLDTAAGPREGGDSGPAVVPGKPAEGTLLKALRHDGDTKMPQNEKLPNTVVKDFEAWIKLGAPDPRVGTVSKPVVAPDAAKTHWAFQPIRPATPPQVQDGKWPLTPVDSFVLRRIEKAGLKPAAEADPLVWLRRVYLDLIGLPPTPQEQAAFRKDPSQKARERVVDDLLARPQYGERWGRHWLDVARYAESGGFEGDGPKAQAWKFRDYVIKSFNDDKPFDRFVQEQIAGDEIAGSDAAIQVAATFLRVGPYESNATFRGVARYNSLDDMIGTTFMAFLGLNLQCARCHDHKFEPLSQLDYHRILAVFEPLDHTGADTSPIGSDAERAAFQKQLDAYWAKVDETLRPLNAVRMEFLEAYPPAKLEGEPLAKISAKDAAWLVERLAWPADKWAKLPPLQQVEERKQLFPGSGRGGVLDAAVSALGTNELKARHKECLDRVKEVLKMPAPTPPTAHVFAEVSTLPKSYMFVRGNIESRGREVFPGLPAVFGGADFPDPQNRRFARTSGRRLWLAGRGDDDHLLPAEQVRDPAH